MPVAMETCFKECLLLLFILRASVAITAASDSSLLPTGCPTTGCSGVLPLGSLSPPQSGMEEVPVLPQVVGILLCAHTCRVWKRQPAR